MEILRRRTLESCSENSFTTKNVRRCIDVLDDSVLRFNITKHLSIKVTPVSASKKENKTVAYLNLNGVEFSVIIIFLNSNSLSAMQFIQPVLYEVLN